MSDTASQLFTNWFISHILPFSQRNLVNFMSRCFMQNNISPIFGWQDVLIQVLEVHIAPNLPRHCEGIGSVANRVLIVIVVRIREGRVEQDAETLQIPLFNEVGIGINVNREIKVVADVDWLLAWQLEHVDSLRQSGYLVDRSAHIRLGQCRKSGGYTLVHAKRRSHF